MTNELTLLTKENFGGAELDFYRNEGLKLVKTEKFAGLDVDFYKDENNNIYMTRNQIGTALGYSNPKRAMSDIHNRNKERLDGFSVVQKIESTDKKVYKTRLYNVNGIRAILQLSDTPLSRKMPLLEYFGEKVYYPIERDEHKYLQVIMDTFRDKETKREYVLGDYRADLIFPSEKVLIECDEYGHKRYCQKKEKERELFFENQGYTIIRFNPNEKNFRIGLVIAEILDVFKNKGVL